MMIWTSGCNTTSTTANVAASITSNCSWIGEVRLSAAGKKALRDAQAAHPEIRTDREALAALNKAIATNCPK